MTGGEDTAGTTVDAFLGGRFRLVQPRRGFRSGSDALFLAATVPGEAGGRIVDLGAGPGAVGLAVAARCPAAEVVLVDAAAEAVALAARSLALPENAALAARVTVVEGDVRAPPGGWSPPVETGGADRILMNPPFFAAGRHRLAPDAARRRARSRSEADAGLEDWLAAARRLLTPRGRLALVMPAAELGGILDGLRRGFGAVTVHPLWPRAGAPAGRVVVTAVRGSRRPLVLAPGLVVHDDEGMPTPAAEAILRHGAALPGVPGD